MSSRARAERPSWEEADRLAALRDYRILDTPPEPDFDDVATLAGAICEAPMALISFIDRDRQWFKSEIGLGVRETPLDTSICRHAILQEDLFVVPDTALDPRFASLPLVVGGPRIRFYAGMPVAAGEGPPLGTLCVMDTNPRPAGLTPSQATGLRTLARQVTAQIELRRLALRHTESEQRLQQALDASGVVGTWSWDVQRDRVIADSRFARLYSLDPALTVSGASSRAYMAMVHPSDRTAVKARIIHTFRTGEEFRVDYRVVKPDGQLRWVTAVGRASRHGDGLVDRLSGVIVDISERKEAEEARSLVTSELTHRIKNIFALTGGLISLSVRGFPEAQTFAQSLQGRLASLSRAHDYVRPKDNPDATDQTLHGLVRTLLEPYAQADRERFSISGADIPVSQGAATALALIVHELATNAVKYGSLSTPDGHVVVEGDLLGENYRLSWRELAGPPVAGDPGQTGFGSQMADRAVKAQLAGAIKREWLAEGLLVTIAAPAERFST